MIKNGVPFDVAHDMELSELLAYAIRFGQYESGREWDWDSMKFVDRS